MNKILEVLKSQGRSQRWLSEKLEKSYNMVNGYAKNRRQPSLDVLFKIAKLLSVNPKDLIDSDYIEIEQ